MMTAGTYLVFRNRIDPVLRVCSVPAAELSRVPGDDLAVYEGQTTFTSGKSYYFSMSRTKARQGELLAICRGLPKLNTVLPGTACTITSLALVRRNTSGAMLSEQMEAVERFFALLTLAGISAFRVVPIRPGTTCLNADIMYDFRTAVLP